MFITDMIRNCLMTKNDRTIYIFGDSYAAADYGREDWKWTKVLSNLYNIKNFAVSGSGSNYSFSRILELIENNKIKENDIMIVFLPEWYRMNFSFFEIGDQGLSLVYNDRHREVFGERYTESHTKWIEKWNRTMTFRASWNYWGTAIRFY